MLQVFLTFAPDTADARRLADEVKAAFEGPETAVKAKPAGRSSILDLEPADLVLFGVGRTEADFPADYAELLRVFPGCNLAGQGRGLLRHRPGPCLGRAAPGAQADGDLGARRGARGRSGRPGRDQGLGTRGARVPQGGSRWPAIRSSRPPYVPCPTSPVRACSSTISPAS